MMVIYEHYESKIPRLFGATTLAVTFGNHIFYKQVKSKVTVKLRVHESKHVEQFSKEGFFGFLFKYFKEYLSGRLKGQNHYESYYRISYEMEAFEAERKHKM